MTFNMACIQNTTKKKIESQLVLNKILESIKHIKTKVENSSLSKNKAVFMTS